MSVSSLQEREKRQLVRCNASLDVWTSLCPNIAFYKFRTFSWKGDSTNQATSSKDHSDARKRNLVNIFGNLEKALDDPMFAIDKRPRLASLVDPETLELIEYVNLLKLVRLWPKWSRHCVKPPRTARRIDCLAVYRTLRPKTDPRNSSSQTCAFLLKQTLDLHHSSNFTKVRRKGRLDSALLVPGIYHPVRTPETGPNDSRAEKSTYSNLPACHSQRAFE